MPKPRPILERRILRGLADLHYLSGAQLTRLLVGPKSDAYVRRHLAPLEREGLIRHDFRQLRKTNAGPTEHYYYLTVKGMQWLAGEGITVPIRTPLTAKRTLFQEHMILVNNTIIAACEWSRMEPERITVETIGHETVLKRDPLVIPVDGKPVRYAPDAWLTIGIRGENALNLLVECDRGTEKEEQWRGKIACLMAGWTAQIRERFGTDRFTALIVVNTGEGEERDQQRVVQLITWTRAELMARHKQAWGDNLLFTACDPATHSGQRFLTHAVATATFGSERIPIL